MAQQQRGFWGSIKGVKLPDCQNAAVAVHKEASHNYGGAAADWVVNADDASATFFIVSNANGAVNMVLPVPTYGGKICAVYNNSGHALLVKCLGGTGFSVTNGDVATFVVSAAEADAIQLSAVLAFAV